MKEACGIIAFLTDFGLSDPYVASMKGVALSVCRNAVLVDITHEVPPFDVGFGSYLLFSAFRYFPPGTVFVAVVDPGVGTSRKPIAIASRNYYFVGPNNGILLLAAEDDGLEAIIALTRDEFFWKPVSSSFHGRDIFAPIAARIACGTSLSSLGEALDSKELVKPGLNIGSEIVGDCVKVWVAHVDRFGNLVLSERYRKLADLLEVGLGDTVRVTLKNREFIALVEKVFSVTPPGTLVLYENSFQLAELAINLGSAEKTLCASRGDNITICRNRPY